MVELELTPGRSCIINGEEFLFFSGYSYLGMNHVKEFTGLVKEGIDKYGLVYPSSRISNTRLRLYEDFERSLSLLNGMEDTVSFSSGFLAGRTIASVLSSYKNIFIAPGTHPAVMIENNRSRHDSENFITWSRIITDLINASNENEFVLICDSVNIFTSEVNDLSFLKEINRGKKLIVLIDYSHGIGLPATEDGGLSINLPRVGNIQYVLSYSLSKALNIAGGAVSCSKELADKLRQYPCYTAGTAINPSMIYAYLNGTALYNVQKKKLLDNITYLKNKATSSSVLQSSFPLPVFICRIQNAEEYFYDNRAIISSFRYPYPSSKITDRVIINALHTTADIDRLCSLL